MSRGPGYGKMWTTRNSMALHRKCLACTHLGAVEKRGRTCMATRLAGREAALTAPSVSLADFFTLRVPKPNRRGCGDASSPFPSSCDPGELDP